MGLSSTESKTRGWCRRGPLWPPLSFGISLYPPLASTRGAHGGTPLHSFANHPRLFKRRKRTITITRMLMRLPGQIHQPPSLLYPPTMTHDDCDNTSNSASAEILFIGLFHLTRRILFAFPMSMLGNCVNESGGEVVCCRTATCDDTLVFSHQVAGRVLLAKFLTQPAGQ